MNGYHISIHCQETPLQNDQHKAVGNDAEITDYPINSYVLYTPPMGRGNKSLPKQRRPYQVRGRKQSIYFIDDLVLGKQIRTHVHNLQPFEVAQQNEQEFLIREDHHRRFSMEFLARSIGYGNLTRP